MALGTEAVRETEGPQEARQRSEHLDMPGARTKEEKHPQGLLG